MSSENFNKFKHSRGIEPQTVSRYNIRYEFFSDLCERRFNINTEDEIMVRNSKLNKGRTADLSRYKNEEKIAEFKRNGYIPLNTFADIYRKEIKINYNTLYKRLFYHNKSIAQYLINENFILVYKTRRGDKVTTRQRTIVNYGRYKEFIELINKHFLNDAQKEQDAV